jgi:hypothetical protein
MKLCAWCKNVEVIKNECCSRTCAGKLRVSKLGTNFMREIGKKGLYNPIGKSKRKAIFDKYRTSENQSNRAKIRNKKMWNDPNYMEYMSRICIFPKLWANEEWANKQRKIIMKNPLGNNEFHFSLKSGLVRYRSNLELQWYLKLDNSDEVLYYEVEPFGIKRNNGSFYFPDLMVHYKNGISEVLEIKHSNHLEDDIVIDKLKVSIPFCELHGYKYNFVTESWLFN